MMTRSQNIAIQSLLDLKNSPQMNLVDLYYVSQNKKNFGQNLQQKIIQLCLTDDYLNKIKNKKIIIYKNDDEYDTAEMIRYKKIKYDLNLQNKINQNYKDIIQLVDNELLDDVTIDMLVDDKDIEISNILANLKNSN
jgi:hypothetical protein